MDLRKEVDNLFQEAEANLSNLPEDAATYDPMYHVYRGRRDAFYAVIKLIDQGVAEFPDLTSHLKPSNT